jgi:hypothetical protein
MARRPSPARRHPRRTESRDARIDALLGYAEKQIEDIANSYEAQLDEQHVPVELSIKIKNCCENMRSALDYLAHRIFERTYPGQAPPAILAFPTGGSRKADAIDAIKRQFPGLRTVNAALWDGLMRAHPYRRGNGWFRDFLNVVNDNKHWDLVAQRRREAPFDSPSFKAPVVFRSGDSAVEFRFRGIEANAIFLLEQALTNIRLLVLDLPY